MIDANLIDVPMPIVTPRLLIRPSQKSDSQAIHEAKIESFDELYKWMIWIANCTKESLSVEQDEIRFCDNQKKFKAREDLQLLAFDKVSDRFIGATGIHDPNWRFKIFRTGYWVRTSEVGKGYATEMATAIVHYVFKALNAHRLSIKHAEGNKASQRVIQKIGYEKEGLFRQSHELPGGQVVDEHCYALLNLDNVPDLDVTWGEV